MRRDLRMVHTIFEELDSFQQTVGDELLSSLDGRFSELPKPEAFYNCRLLVEAGLVSGSVEINCDPPEVLMSHVTWKGHEWRDAVSLAEKTAIRELTGLGRSSR
jgi:hypothetical protein